MQPPNTMPSFSTMTYPGDVPGLFAESPIPSQASGAHSRTRSLSSAEMVNRGLIINATNADDQSGLNAAGNTWPDTPSKGRLAQSEGTSGSPGMILHASPNGQGFPTSQSMDSISSVSMSVAPRHHLRSATDSGQAAYMLGHAQAAMASGGMDLDHLQDANKEDHQRTIRGHVAKASITSLPLQSPIAGQQSVFAEASRQHQQQQQQHQRQQQLQHQHQQQQQQQMFLPAEQLNGNHNAGQQQQQQFTSPYPHRTISISITGSEPSSRDGSQNTTPITPGFGSDASAQAQMDMAAAAAGSGYYHHSGDSGSAGANSEGQANYGQMYSAYHTGPGSAGEGASQNDVQYQ